MWLHWQDAHIWFAEAETGVLGCGNGVRARGLKPGRQCWVNVFSGSEVQWGSESQQQSQPAVKHPQEGWESIRL